MNKRVIILFIGFALIAGILILNSTVFTISSIDVAYDSQQSAETENALSENIIEASGVKIGKNVFTLSESTVVKNIQSKVPNVRILSIERKFPDKLIIHASRRMPILAIPFKQKLTDKTMYAIVDSEMYVLSVVENINSDTYSLVGGFLLSGDYDIVIGERLTTKFGAEIFYLQNIAVSFEQAGLLPEEYAAFISQITFLQHSNMRVDILTNSGVEIIIDNLDKLSTEQINNRIQKIYVWYNSFSETDEEVLGGYAFYDEEQGKFVWYNTQKTE